MDINSLMEINIDKVDQKILLNMENIIGIDWDVIKEEKTCFELKRYRRDTEDVEVIVGIKEKTIDLGAARNDEELVLEALTLNVDGSVIKVFQMSLFEKHDPNDDEKVEIYSKKSKLEVNMDLVVKGVSEEKKRNWEFMVNMYLIRHLTEKNKERFEEKMNRIQGPTFKSLIDGTWKPVKEETEPDFSVKVEDLVAFGDFWDANKKVSENVSSTPGCGTIHFNINTVRRFVPGIYKISVIDIGTPIAIFHHESVSPRKIAINLMLTTDLSEYTPTVSNSLNRYDWCHATYWDGPSDDEGDEDENSNEGEENKKISWPLDPVPKSWEYSLYRSSKMRIIYFTPVTNSQSFEVGVKKGFQKESTNVSGAHQIYGPIQTGKHERKEQSNERSDTLNETEVKYEEVSIGFNMNNLDKDIEWHYGAVFEDEQTNKNFALVVHSYISHLKHFELGAPEAFKKQSFSKEKNKFMFKMEDFINTDQT